jgi:hypothetical protein
MAEQYVPKPGTGSAFKNENKTEDWHGDYQGKIVLPEVVVPGATYYFNIYNNQTKTGNPYLGVSIGKQVQPKGESASAPAVEADMPF